MTTTRFDDLTKKTQTLTRELREAREQHERTVENAARLALDLGRAKRRIAELEAAESRVRALADRWQAVGNRGGMATEDVLLRAVAYQLFAALDGPPDEQVREVPA